MQSTARAPNRPSSRTKEQTTEKAIILQMSKRAIIITKQQQQIEQYKNSYLKYPFSLTLAYQFAHQLCVRNGHFSGCKEVCSLFANNFLKCQFLLNDFVEQQSCFVALVVVFEVIGLQLRFKALNAALNLIRYAHIK